MSASDTAVVDTPASKADINQERVNRLVALFDQDRWFNMNEILLHTSGKFTDVPTYALYALEATGTVVRGSTYKDDDYREVIGDDVEVIATNPGARDDKGYMTRTRKATAWARAGVEALTPPAPPAVAAAEAESGEATATDEEVVVPDASEKKKK